MGGVGNGGRGGLGLLKVGRMQSAVGERWGECRGSIDCRKSLWCEESVQKITTLLNVGRQRGSLWRE